MNADAETLGAAAADDVDAELLAAVVELLLELEVELELEDELPQAVTARLAVTVRAAKTVLLLSKCTVNSSFSSLRDKAVGQRRARTVQHRHNERI